MLLRLLKPGVRTLWAGRLGEERGSALMAAFWMLVVLLLAGLAASYATTTEIGLSGNQRLDAQRLHVFFKV